MDERGACAEIRELLPELAAGDATGHDRALAMGHVGECPRCRRELDEMAAVVDELLTLAPAAEPPGGFESRVLAKLTATRRRPRWWRHPALRPATVAVLAAVLAAAVGVATTMYATADDRRVANAYRRTLDVAQGRYVTANAFTAPDGARAGYVCAYQGTPSWVFVVVQYDRATGPYEVRLLTRDGRDRLLGEVDVASGAGYWGVAIDVEVAQIAEIRLSGPAVSPLSATFRGRASR